MDAYGTTSGLAYWVTKVMRVSDKASERSIGSQSIQVRGDLGRFHAAMNGPLTIRPNATIIPKWGGLNPAETETSIPKMMCQVRSPIPDMPKIRIPSRAER